MHGTGNGGYFFYWKWTFVEFFIKAFKKKLNESWLFYNLPCLLRIVKNQHFSFFQSPCQIRFNKNATPELVLPHCVLLRACRVAAVEVILYGPPFLSLFGYLELVKGLLDHEKLSYPKYIFLPKVVHRIHLGFLKKHRYIIAALLISPRLKTSK